MSPRTFGTSSSGTGGSGTPASPDTSVQFNDGGSFGGDANFTFDKITNILTVDAIQIVSNNDPTLFIKTTNDSPYAIVIENNTAAVTSGIYMDNAGLVHWDNPVALNPNGPIWFTTSASSAGLATLDDTVIFLAAEDGQPGTDLTDQGRHLITYARPATALKPVSGASNVLAGWFFTGGISAVRDIELENKVIPTTGVPEFWLEAIIGSSAFPFLRSYRTGSNNDGIISTDRTNGSAVLNLAAWDANDSVDRIFVALTSGNTPSMVVAPPTGGTVTLQATTYKSSDGTSGVSGTFDTSSFKDGLLTTLGNGYGMATSAYSTDGNLAAAVNTLYIADISGFTADRTLTLPATAAVGDRVGVYVSVTNATKEFLITATSGDTLNGIAGGTEWSRVFIANELVIMRCVVANTTWLVEEDGRIPCVWYFSNSGFALTANTVMYPDWTVNVDTGGLYVNATKDYALIRRPGNYTLSTNWLTSTNYTTANSAYAQFHTDPNGTPVVLSPNQRIQSGASNDRLGPTLTTLRNLAVDTNITATVQQSLSTTSSTIAYYGTEELKP